MAETDAVPIQILRDALEMEQQGKEFFERAAGLVKHETARNTFLGLVKQEERHVSILGGELARIQSGKAWASLSEMRQRSTGYPKISVFDDKEIRRIKIRPEAGEIEVLEIGVKVEQKSIDYYKDAAARVSDEKAKEIFDWLVGEESGHLTILRAERDSRIGSGYYFDSAEFSLEVM
jgi:rubrerythrin